MKTWKYRSLLLGSLLISLLSTLLACSPDTNESKKVRIGINPWPGYEFLYLAAQKDIYSQYNLNIELVELASLADVQRAYVQGHVDGIASTIVEAVQAGSLTQEQTTIVLVPDYSNGGDVIIANTSIKGTSELKNKKIGAEIDSLGTYILSLALNKQNLTLADVELLNYEQLAAEEALLKGEIDAMVTYPPFSTKILKHDQFKQIFSSADTPEEVIDVVSIRSSVLKQQPEWVKNFHLAWQAALEYANKNSDESYKIMADREGISPEEFSEALTGLKILPAKEQAALLNSRKLERNIIKVCKSMQNMYAKNYNCETVTNWIYPAKI